MSLVVDVLGSRVGMVLAETSGIGAEGTVSAIGGCVSSLWKSISDDSGRFV